MTTILLYEILGTATLLLLGCGVVADVALARSKGEGGGFLLVDLGWGLAVFAAVFVGWKSGAQINPAVTIGLLVSGADEYAPGIDVTVASTLTYLAAQLVGAFLGAVLAWLACKDHFDATPDAEAQLGVFSTGPAISNPVWNRGDRGDRHLRPGVRHPPVRRHAARARPPRRRPARRRHRRVARWPTGYAINPARDLGPRIAHAVLPMRGKGGSDWSCARVPVVGPTIGGALGGLAATAVGV